MMGVFIRSLDFLDLPSLQHHRMSRGPGVVTVYIGRSEASSPILG